MYNRCVGKRQITLLCIISECTDKNNEFAGYRWQIVHPDYLSLKWNEYDASLSNTGYLDCLNQLSNVFLSVHFMEEVVLSKPAFRYRDSETVVDKFEICFQIEPAETK